MQNQVNDLNLSPEESRKPVKEVGQASDLHFQRLLGGPCYMERGLSEQKWHYMAGNWFGGSLNKMVSDWFRWRMKKSARLGEIFRKRLVMGGKWGVGKGRGRSGSGEPHISLSSYLISQLWSPRLRNVSSEVCNTCPSLQTENPAPSHA